MGEWRRAEGGELSALEAEVRVVESAREEREGEGVGWCNGVWGVSAETAGEGVEVAEEGMLVVETEIGEHCFGDDGMEDNQEKETDGREGVEQEVEGVEGEGVCALEQKEGVSTKAGGVLMAGVGV